MNKVLSKVLNFLKNIIFTDYDSCYKDMENKGSAHSNCCNGIVGGSSATEYVSETCLGCPYLKLITLKRK